jgi:energy-converting hydrogenase Eha subunit H
MTGNLQQVIAIAAAMCTTWNLLWRVIETSSLMLPLMISMTILPHCIQVERCSVFSRDFQFSHWIQVMASLPTFSKMAAFCIQQGTVKVLLAQDMTEIKDLSTDMKISMQTLIGPDSEMVPVRMTETHHQRILVARG